MTNLRLHAKLLCILLLTGCGAGNFGIAEPSDSSTTTTTLTASATAVTTGTAVTFSAAVTPAGPAGTVTFLDGTTTLGSAPVSSGRATLAVPSLTAGTHSVSASYSGTAGFFASSSAAVRVSVSNMLTPSSITLTASPTTGAVGTNVVLTATAIPGVTGIVTFFDSTTSLGAAVLTTNATATYSTAQLAAGTHTLTAIYGGSTTYAGSTSPGVMVVLR